MLKKIWIVIVSIIIIVVSSFFIWVFMNQKIGNYTTDFVYDQKDKTAFISSVRIGTYNIKSLNMGKDLQSFANDVNSEALDIICLQEVDQHAFRSNQMDMMVEMAKLSEYPYYYFFPAMWLVDGYYGLGILSKYPILHASSTVLPNAFWKEPRVLAEATIDINGYKLQVYNTHLSFDDKESRSKQIQYLQSFLKNRKQTVLLGDFNTFRENSHFVIDEMTGVNNQDDIFITFRKMGYPDNIYVSSDLSINQVGVKNSTFSDHHLLYGNLIFD